MSQIQNTKTIHRINVTKEILSSLSDDEIAFFALVNHAYSEINVLGRLAYYSVNHKELSPTLRVAVTHQSLTIIRCRSAKLFEFHKAIEKQSNAGNEDRTAAIASFALDEFEKHNLQRDYNVVRNIRDYTTNHYDPVRVKENLEHLNDEMQLALYLAEPDANSFTLIGDEISFTGRLNRMFASRKLEEGESAFNVWWKWNHRAWKWVRLVSAKTNEVMLLDTLPDQSVDKIVMDLPDAFVADGDFVLPVFTSETETK
ncbi:hypothetical protein [Marivita geojedonensis]|uniref:Uncharacterized protein n=1 Tax=Marivita geojedonensis TaxID=1123756 RepID=A0A1X4NR16_9RHOB|nr:hypothetical protein [Marivita geojedonensis]OSQ53414.1 hypothetical protein MGEO_02425 [Marivita geojedonensis]PRY81603.1 hypothetical protein CLV76_101142 [Marivita geojedonensis]